MGDFYDGVQEKIADFGAEPPVVTTPPKQTVLQTIKSTSKTKLAAGGALAVVGAWAGWKLFKK
jgi:hypothetical protein